MSTFRKISVKSEVEGDEPLSDYAIGYLNARVRNGFYDYVLRRFDEEARKRGLSKAELARRLNLGPDRISKLLGSPGNWTLDTVSELLVGICREELVPDSRSYLNRASRNFRAEDDLLQNIPSLQQSATPLQDEGQSKVEKEMKSEVGALSEAKGRNNGPQQSKLSSIGLAA